MSFWRFVVVAFLGCILAEKADAYEERESLGLLFYRAFSQKTVPQPIDQRYSRFKEQAHLTAFLSH